ncbi:MAG: hypothetical protein JWQ11_4303 [Rhizobacter sp.]|nr:hypothetical protein [Rhizobacter sp.]
MGEAMKFSNLFKRPSVAEQASEAARQRREKAAAVAPGASPTMAQRSPLAPNDLVLSRSGVAWKTSIPTSIRPHELCAQYPRIANRLALCWNDALLTERVFDDLLLDRRGKRKGFPGEVASELLHLRVFYAKHHKSALRNGLWDSSSIAVSDR